MGKKKSGQKMSLNDFLGGPAAATGASWADEMELPTAPSADALPSGPRGGDRFSERPVREYEERSRPIRDGPVELPTSGPYIAYVANLAFSVTEGDLRNYFEDDKIISVRIPINHETQKPRGFAYVEFVDVQSLATAIEKEGHELLGRTIHVNVAEQKDRPSDRTTGVWRREASQDVSSPQAPNLADTSSTWRRANAPPASAERGSGSRYNSNSFDRLGREDSEQRGPKPIFSDSVGDWRSGGSSGGNAFGSRRNDSESRPSESGSEPARRKKLELLPRSKPVN